MLAGRLGADGFRRGMDLYFERNDGRAATLEDFLGALGEANGVDLLPYLAWYGQSGTPRLRAHGRHDAARREYTLTLGQHAPTVAGQTGRTPLPIPVKLALFADDGRMLPLQLAGEASHAGSERVVVLAQAEQALVFTGIDAPPVPSLLRGFSAPVVLECDYTPAELALLLAHDPDGFNRWEAGQLLAARAYENLRDGNTDASLRAWSETLARLFADDHADDALLADLLTPPGEIELAEREGAVDPARIHQLRQLLQRQLAERLGSDALEQRYRTLAARTSGALDAPSQASRRLKRRVLELLEVCAAERAQQLAAAQYRDAPGMTDRLAALTVLARGQSGEGERALADYRQRYAGNALALDKWLAVQAQLPGLAALPRVMRLEKDAAFTLHNPNRVQSLLGTFVRGNPSGFHRADGAAYRFLTERLGELDALNPQVAARLATAFNGWQRLEPGRRALAQAAIAELARRAGLSRNLGEIIGNVLNH
jgi:aminopeptidase N